MTVENERTLLVLRHAKSDWSGGEADIDRTLNPRGQGQAAEVGSWLADQFSPIDAAVVSPATRARATWALVSAELGHSPEARIDERAYAASVTDLLSIVQDLPDEQRTVILVAHNPGLEELVLLLVPDDRNPARDDVEVKFPTASLAELRFDIQDWERAGPGKAALIRFVRPRDLDSSLGPDTP